MQNGKSDNSKPKSPPPLSVYYTDARGLRGNFTDLEAFMLKNNPDIFAHCETNRHDDIQNYGFQLPAYLSILYKDAGHMHGLGVYAKSNLPIARETIFEDENEFYVFSFVPSTFYYLHIFLVSFAIFGTSFCG